MNFKILLITALVAVLTACGGAEERKAVYMEKAKSSIEAGDFDKARIELKNVLQIDPKDDDAYYELGKVYEAQKDYTKAYRNYMKAEELNPDNLANQAKLGRLYLVLANDLEKGQGKIDIILSKDPRNNEGLILKALMMLKKENKVEAITIAKEVVASEPGNVEGVSLLATLYATDNNLNEAINLLENSLQISPDNTKLNELLALFLVKNKDYKKAEIVYKSFLERKPDATASYNKLADFYHQSGDKIKAEETLRASVDNDPDSEDRILTLLKYIKEVKGDDEAIKELEELIVKNNRLGKLRIALAELKYINDDKDAAINIYKTAIKDFPEEVTGVESRIALASIYINDKEFEKASNILEDALNVSPNDPKVNLLRAKLAIHNKDLEKAIISLRVVTNETPEDIEAYLLLVNAYKLENNNEQVRSALNSAFDNNKMNPDGLIKLAQYHLSDDIEQAEKVIDHYNNIKESDYDGLSIKAAILNKKELQFDAHKIAEKLIKMYPEKPNGYLQAVPYYIQQRDMQTAIVVLEKGYSKTKDNRKILTILTTIQGANKQFDVVENRIKNELKITPDDVELKILLYKLYMASGKSDLAESVLLETIESKPGLEELYLLLAQFYEVKRDLSSLKAILLKGDKNVKDSVKIKLKLASVYEIESDYSKALVVYRDLYKIKPDNIVIINNLASMLSDHGDGESDLELARTLVDKLKERQETVFLDTIGWVYYKTGDYDNAIQYLKTAVEKSPEISIFNYHLGMAYKIAGDVTKAKVYLEKSLADNKPFKQKELAEQALNDLI